MADKLNWIGLAVLAVGLLIGGFYLGCWYQTAQNATKLATMQAQLASYESMIEDAKSYSEGIDAAMAQTEGELETLKQQKATNEQLYKDTLTVIRAMLPDRAEREIANYYRNAGPSNKR